MDGKILAVGDRAKIPRCSRPSSPPGRAAWPGLFEGSTTQVYWALIAPEGIRKARRRGQ
jgi:hypothetical protein